MLSGVAEALLRALSQTLVTEEEKEDESGVAEAASGPSSTPDRVGVAGGA